MKSSRVLEIIWLIAGLAAVAMAIYNLLQGNPEEKKNYLLWLVAIICFGIFFYRRRLRRTSNHSEDN